MLDQNYLVAKMHRMKSALSQKSIAKRLRGIREGLGLGNQAVLAARLGATVNQYNNWETGTAKIPVSYATRLCVLTGVTLDYIFRGEVSALPVRLVTLLPSELDAGLAASGQ